MLHASLADLPEPSGKDPQHDFPCRTCCLRTDEKLTGTLEFRCPGPRSPLFIEAGHQGAHHAVDIISAARWSTSAQHRRAHATLLRACCSARAATSVVIRRRSSRRTADACPSGQLLARWKPSRAPSRQSSSTSTLRALASYGGESSVVSTLPVVDLPATSAPGATSAGSHRRRQFGAPLGSCPRHARFSFDRAEQAVVDLLKCQASALQI